MTNKEALKTLIDTYSKGAKLSKRESKIYEHGLLDGIQFSKREAEQLPRWKKEDFISSLPEEPVSEDLEEMSRQYALNNTPDEDCADEIKEAFKAGALWQKTKDVEKTMSWLEYHVDAKERENYKEYMKED